MDSRDTHSFGFESFGIKATLTTFEDIWKTISVAVKTRQDLSHHQTPSANIGGWSSGHRGQSTHYKNSQEGMDDHDPYNPIHHVLTIAHVEHVEL